MKKKKKDYRAVAFDNKKGWYWNDLFFGHIPVVKTTWFLLILIIILLLLK